VLKREDIIRWVAAAVGPGHEVDLKDFDLLIIVEVYKVRLKFSAVLTLSKVKDNY
jgi:tRNA acetyltransferase TAN1